MKKIICLTLLLSFALICFSFTSCDSSINDPEDDISDTEETFILSPALYEEDGVDSSDVTVSMEMSEYSASSLPDELTVLIYGSNINDNKICMYDVPSLEVKSASGEWTAVPYKLKGYETIAYDEGFYWMTSRKPNDDDELIWSLSIDVKKLAVELSEGEYRALVYLPDKTLYAYFEIV